METRASHLIVGIFVLLLSIGTAIFGVWLAKREVDTAFTIYEIAFPGSVFGLQEGSQVVYRGVPVGRVSDIGFDPGMPDEVVVEVEIDQSTPVTVDTTAGLMPQGVTGLLAVELTGGDPAAAMLEADDGPPRIEGRVSAIEQLFTSTPQLLSRGVAVMERVATALSEDNIARLATTMDNLEQVSTTIAGRTDEIDQLLADSGNLGGDTRQMLLRLASLLEQGERLTGTLADEVTAVTGSSVAALDEVGAAASAARNLAGRADRVLAEGEQPLQDFGNGGLYEFSEMVREVRILVAALNRIATDFERDPAGFLIGGNQRGFTPQ